MAQLKEGSIIKKSTGDEVIATLADITSVTKSDIGLSNVTNDKQMPIAGGTFTGISKAQSNTSHTVPQIRNITFKRGTNDFTTSELANGEIGFLYE